MEHVDYNTLANIIRNNLYKIPHDIDVIVGVPRSGLLGAIMIGEYLSKPVMTLNEFLNGYKYAPIGGRFTFNTNYKKILVVDDTVNSGKEMRRTKEKLSHIQDKQIIYCCVFAEGENAKNFVDIYFCDFYKPNRWYYPLYEWNIFHHLCNDVYMTDLDGVLCKNPPDDRNVSEYENYIANAIPILPCSTPYGAIVTYRLEKYRAVTEQWLRNNNITYKNLIMVKAKDRYERERMYSPSSYKAEIYKKADWAKLFIESDNNQATHIAQITGKPVYSFEQGVVLNNTLTL